MLVTGVVWRGSGFASQIGCQNPGEHSLKLGTAGLYDGRPLAFKAKMSVCYASLNKWAHGFFVPWKVCGPEECGSFHVEVPRTPAQIRQNVGAPSHEMLQA